jgi:endoglucanase
MKLATKAATAICLATAVTFATPNAGLLAAGSCVDVAPGVPADTIRALSHGVNLDGWMNSPASGAPNRAVLRALRRDGMSHVRLPIPAEQVMARFTAEPDLAAELRAIDAALTELTALGYYVSIDLHPSDLFSELHRDRPSEAMSAMQDAWRNLASVIRHHPVQMVLAELLNEPDIDAQRWQTEAEQLGGFVRQLLPRTTLIAGPTNWQRADSLPGFRPLNDTNVIYALHFYDPMVFTHQGHWDPQDPMSSIRGLPFPVRADDPAVKKIRQQLLADDKQRSLHELDVAIAQDKAGEDIAAQLEPAVAWQRQFSRQIIINEFGVLKAQAPPESRRRWLHAVVNFAEAHCWGWTHWELAQGFGLIDDKTGKPDAAVMRALLGPR